MDKIRDLKSPIFGLFIINNYLIVASGGGGKQYGVKNKLFTYKLSSNGISEVISEKEVEDLPVFISGLQLKSLFCVCMSNASHFYSINNKGEFNEVYHIETLPIKSKEIFQSVGQMSIDGEYFCCGTNTGILKLYNMILKQNGEIESIVLHKEAVIHIRSINNIIILSQKQIILTASGDCSCKMLDIVTLKQLAKITFRQSLNEPANYFMRNLIYDNYYNVVYTLQSPLRGKTFITKWDLNQNLKPIRTVEVNDKVCLSFSYNQALGVIGVIEAEGNLIFVDSKDLNIISKEKIGENSITSGQFYDKYFITGSVDNLVRMTKVRGVLFGFVGLLFKLFIIGLIAYYIYLKKYNGDVDDKPNV